jgi:hypothetical protein
LQKCLNCHVERSETSLRFLATLRFAQNDIHDFLTFARSLMIIIREINPLSSKLLERIYRQNRHHQVRQRAPCLILASQEVKIEELMKIFQVSYKTIYNWLNRW